MKIVYIKKKPNLIISVIKNSFVCGKRKKGNRYTYVCAYVTCDTLRVGSM